MSLFLIPPSGRGSEEWGVPPESQACRSPGAVGGRTRGRGGAQGQDAGPVPCRQSSVPLGLEATSRDSSNYRNQTVDTNYAPGEEATAAARGLGFAYLNAD